MRAWRVGHYAILTCVWAAVTLPFLGAPSLWDMDEGVNAECTREMIESGTLVVPTFNWELRTAKPILTYWLARPFFHYFGPTELAARLPSALLGLGTLLLTYELARRMFGAMTGLLSGIILATALQFVVQCHAATPDAPLLFYTTLAFVVFWLGHENQRRHWWLPMAVACGFAALTKGPVGVVLPAAVVVGYFLWQREWRRLLSWRMLPATFVLLAITVPWYGLVAAETRGEWPEKFFGDENLGRATAPKEGHSGPIVYYVLALMVMFAPWSSFIGAVGWYTVAGCRRSTNLVEMPAIRFLAVWFTIVLIAFSLAATKLPSYIAPLYPAAAILTARYLILWANRSIHPAPWVMQLGIAAVSVTGILFGLGMLLAGGETGLTLPGIRIFPGLGSWAWLGLIPVAGNLAMGFAILKERRGLAVASLAISAIAFVTLAALGPPRVVDRQKAAKSLVQESGAFQPERDIRLAAVGYFQESLVFYAQRRIERIAEDDVPAFLALPRPAYLFVPTTLWEDELKSQVTVPVRIVGRKYDFYRDAEILVITNE